MSPPPQETETLRASFSPTYCMAGIINVATQLSERWEDVRCRVSS